MFESLWSRVHNIQRTYCIKIVRNLNPHVDFLNRICRIRIPHHLALSYILCFNSLRFNNQGDEHAIREELVGQVEGIFSDVFQPVSTKPKWNMVADKCERPAVEH